MGALHVVDADFDCFPPPTATGDRSSSPSRSPQPGQALVEQKSAHFDPSKFAEAALQELLDKKQKGQPIAKMAPRTIAKVVNLMDAIRASLESDKSSSKKPKAKPATAKGWIA